MFAEGGYGSSVRASAQSCIFLLSGPNERSGLKHLVLASLETLFLLLHPRQRKVISISSDAAFNAQKNIPETSGGVVCRSKVHRAQLNGDAGLYWRNSRDIPVMSLSKPQQEPLGQLMVVANAN